MLTLLLSASVALPCAGLITTEDTVASSDAQEVIFRTDGVSTEVEYNVRYVGDSDDIGWIIPIFGEFEAFNEVEADLFDDYRSLSAPWYIEELAEDPGCRSCSGASKGNDAETGGARGDFGDPVLAEGYSGDFEYTALDGGNLAAVYKWLGDHDWDYSSQSSVLQGYSSIGSDFVVVRLMPSRPNTTAEGRTLMPVRITYAGDTMRFPAIMSSAGMLDTYRTTIWVEGSTRASLVSGWTEEEFGTRDAIDPDMDPADQFDQILYDLAGPERVYALVWAGEDINGTFLTRFDTHADRGAHLDDPIFELSDNDDTYAQAEIIEAPSAEAIPWGLLLTAPLFGIGWARRRRD